MWHDEVKIRHDKVVVKLKNNDGSFLKSVIVPTVYYPLPANDFRVFTQENTDLITDEKILSLIDSVSYKIGHCYTNTKKVVDLLNSCGYSVECYVGWLFVDNNCFPIHHCWAVLDDNKIIDLADDFSAMYSKENSANWNNVKTKKEYQEILLSFTKEARKWKNSVRCYPVGKATDFLFYVGSKCEADRGRYEYQKLLKDFPNHECERNCNADGLNETQKLFKASELM